MVAIFEPSDAEKTRQLDARKKLDAAKLERSPANSFAGKTVLFSADKPKD